jgi:hypothetical protein
LMWWTVSTVDIRTNAVLHRHNARSNIAAVRLISPAN